MDDGSKQIIDLGDPVTVAVLRAIVRESILDDAFVEKLADKIIDMQTGIQTHIDRPGTITSF